ncbi:MAG: hypothetical protein B7X48_12155 [Acidiphilium sp. 34-60-192]|nr:MAG: hypothetical protein B7X48_12155 [Acidiphilium sp. 34-60-192]
MKREAAMRGNVQACAIDMAVARIDDMTLPYARVAGWVCWLELPRSSLIPMMRPHSAPDAAGRPAIIGQAAICTTAPPCSVSQLPTGVIAPSRVGAATASPNSTGAVMMRAAITRIAADR